jgi:ADP-ribose pyrophosphatase YjhB (NUDIX family)
MDGGSRLTASGPGAVHSAAVALVPVIACAEDIGLLVVTHGEEHGGLALPSVDVDVSDTTWEDALVRAVREQTGLSVTFDSHVVTVSIPNAEVLIFGQTQPVDATQVGEVQGVDVRVITSHRADAPFAVDAHAQVVARWFAGHPARSAGIAATDRRSAISGRRAVDAEALVLTDFAGAVSAVNELVSQDADFYEDQYARTLLDRVVCSLSLDQRDRWGERGSDLLLTFLWHDRRDQLPVDDMFDLATEWARAEARAHPACFGRADVDRARVWMDTVALAHGVGRVMAPFHVAEPVGLVRSMLGFGRFGRLDAKLRGNTETILTELDEARWELVYVALGARKQVVLTPDGLHPEELLDAFADVLAHPKELQAAR